MTRYIKRTVALLLVTLLLISTFTACKSSVSDEETEPAGNAQITDKYRIVTSVSASDKLMKASQRLAEAIRIYTGIEVKTVRDGIAPEEGTAEILLGGTNREKSTQSLESLGDGGYTVRNMEGTVVIVGKNDSITADGIEFFIGNILSKCDAGVTSLPIDDGFVYNSNGYSSIELVKDQKSTFTVVYSSDIDDMKNDGYVNDGVDYEYAAALKIKEKLESLGAAVELKSDRAAESGSEILVGKTNRAQSKSLLKALAYTQYGYGYSDGSIAIGGYSTVATVLACEMFEDAIDSSKIGKNVTLSLGECTARTNMSWTLGFPKYEGGRISGISESYADALQYYITKTTREEYAAYIAKLDKLGYERTMSNVIEGNLFAAYNNGDVLIYVYYIPSEEAVRLIVGDCAKIEFPVSSTENYQKITDVSVTQMQLDFTTNSGGMGYIITLEDGSFVMIDSGSTSNANRDHDRMWNLLNTLNKREDGRIIIRAWLMTHGHSDHFAVFKKFCESYGDKVTIEKYYECVPSYSATYNAKNPVMNVMTGRVEEASRAVKGGFDIVMLHTGMKFSMYGAEFETLYTLEDMYPKTINYFNESSTVFKMTAGGQSVMFLGDIYINASAVLLDRYTRSTLKADIVQVAHHGNNGATKTVYEAISPKVMLWPTSVALFNNLTAGVDTLTQEYVVDRYIYTSVNSRGGEHFTCSDYSVELMLPYAIGSAKYHKVS